MTRKMRSWIFHQAPLRRAGLPWLLLGGIAGGGGACKADDIVPKTPPVAKYAKMAAHSPFAPPTVPVAPQATPPPPPVPGWADNLTVTMLVQDGDKFMVTVVDAQNPQHLYLSMEPDKDTQMAVASVRWGANREDPPAITLRKGKEFAQVRYESGASSPGGSNAMGGGALPGAARPGSPGAQTFRPPPLANNGSPLNQGTGNAIRRPLIQAPRTAPTTRPGVNLPSSAVRPNPGLQVDDDDDDE